jgi:hypothetical protein
MSYDAHNCLIGVSNLAKRSGTCALINVPLSVYSYSGLRGGKGYKKLMREHSFSIEENENDLENTHCSLYHSNLMYGTEKLPFVKRNQSFYPYHRILRQKKIVKAFKRNRYSSAVSKNEQGNLFQ